MTRSPRWPSYLLVVLVAVLAVILASAGLVAWVAYGLSQHSPEPDAGAYSRSAAVRRLSPATPAALRQLVARYRAEFGQPGEGVGLVQAIPPDPAQLDRVATGRYDNLLMVTLQGSYATARQ